MASRNILQLIIDTIARGSGVKETTSDLEKLDKITGKVNQVLGAFGLALGAKEVFDFSMAAAAAARAQKDSENTLTSLVGSTQRYNEAIAQVKGATQGMVSETGAARAAFGLLDNGIAKTASEAANYALAGKALEASLGAETASYEKFLMLLDQGSPMLLNNFNLTDTMVEARQRLIESNTNLEGSEARLQAVRELALEKGLALSKTMSEDTIAAEQFKAASEDLTAAIGELLVPTIADAQSSWSSYFQTLTNGLTVINEATQRFREAGVTQAELSNIQGGMTEEMQHAIEATRVVVSSLQAMNISTERAATAAEQEAAAMRNATSSLNAMGFGAAGAAEAHDPLIRGMMTAAQKAREEAQAVRELAAARKENLAQMAQESQGRQNLLAAKESAPELGAKITENRAAVFEMAQDKEEAEQRANERAAKQMAKSFTQAADDIGNTISGKLQTTFQEVFKLPEGASDQADEPARRLATVAASGFGSEWLTQLNAQFAGQDFWAPMTAAMQSGSGEQLQAAATGILQQFSQGLITNLFDVNVIRGQVRAEMVQKRLKEQLIEEVKAGLGTQGISQAIGVVEVAAGNVGVATAQTETNVSTMAATAATAGGEMKASFDAPLASVNVLILRIIELNKQLERTKVLAQEAGGGIGALNPPVPGAGGTPNGAQNKMGGNAPL